MGISLRILLSSFYFFCNFDCSKYLPIYLLIYFQVLRLLLASFGRVQLRRLVQPPCCLSMRHSKAHLFLVLLSFFLLSIRGEVKLISIRFSFVYFTASFRILYISSSSSCVFVDSSFVAFPVTISPEQVTYFTPRLCRYFRVST